MWCEGSQGATVENAWTHDTPVCSLDEQPAAELCVCGPVVEVKIAAFLPQSSFIFLHEPPIHWPSGL